MLVVELNGHIMHISIVLKFKNKENINIYTFKVNYNKVKGQTILVVVLNFRIMPISIVEDCLAGTKVDRTRFCLWTDERPHKVIPVCYSTNASIIIIKNQ